MEPIAEGNEAELPRPPEQDVGGQALLPEDSLAAAATDAEAGAPASEGPGASSTLSDGLHGFDAPSEAETPASMDDDTLIDDTLIQEVETAQESESPAQPTGPAIPAAAPRVRRRLRASRRASTRPGLAIVVPGVIMLLIAAIALGSLGVQHWGNLALAGSGARSATSPSATASPTATATPTLAPAPTATPDPMLAWNNSMGCANGHPPSAPQVVFGTKNYATGSAAPPEVALTFDDGPTPSTSPPIFDYLEQSHTPATFFVLGLYARSWPYLVQREWRDGFAIGVHSWDHPMMTIVPDAQMPHQFGDTLVAIHAAIGQDACIWFWRPPYGAFDSRVVSRAQQYGLTTIQWNADPADWSRPGVDVIVSRVLAQVRPGSIVVMHDGPARREQTAAALPLIVAGLRQRGLTPVTLPQLLSDSYYPGVATYPTQPPINENAAHGGSVALPARPTGPVPIVPDGGNSGE